MSKLRDDLAAFERDLNDVLLRWARIIARYKHFLALADDPQHDVDDAPVAVITGHTLPPPVPVPAPATASMDTPIVTNVHTTCWLNKSDDDSGETAKQPMYPWAPRNEKKIGLTLVGAAVPMHVDKGDQVRVRHANGGWVYIPIIEGGPHRTSDTYLIDGTRPLAESIDKNRAGLDLTPAAMALVNGKSAQQNYDSEPSIALDVQLVRAGQVPNAHVVVSDLGARIVGAARALPDPFPYAPETDHGRLGCADVVSTALHDAGAMGGVVLSVDALVAELLRLGWIDASPEKYSAGNVIVFVATEATNGHKHVGILGRDPGGDLTVINNSSSREKVVEQKLSTYDRPILRVLAAP
jgi:hypothetical protein